jgi:tetratricopeptide (TPR) repeat protein
MATLANAQQSIAEQLADQIVGSAPRPDSVWQVNGSAGAGKTTLLRRTADILRDRRLVAILVSAPEGELDAGAVALVHVAAGLKDAGLVNGQVDQLRDPSIPSLDKLTKVQQWIGDHSGEVVLLFDEPTIWYDARPESFPDASQRLAREFVPWVAHSATCRRVIGGPSPDPDRPPLSFTAPRVEDPEEFLTDARIWGALTAPAESLVAWSQDLRGATPLLLRLLVALSSVRSAEWVLERLRTFQAEKRVVTVLLDELAVRGDHHEICRELTRLSAVRGPIPSALLDPLASRLGPARHDLIVRCLSTGDGAQTELHPLVRRGVLARVGRPPWTLPASQIAQLHEDLAQSYAKTAQAAKCPLPDQMEEFHHRLQVGDAAHPVRGAHFFPEQLHAAGRYLSYDAHRHNDAASIFERCLSYDDRDDYAHHYLAYNLDWQAVDPKRIEEHYQRAIELNRRHPWWWSRWISYLVTRGRSQMAQSEWRRALDALNISGLDTPSERAIAKSLHRWVARWLLHWSQLDFAEIVLESVPPQYRAEDSSLRALDRLLRSLREAERAYSVFPLSVPPECWWTREPHLTFPRVWEGQPLADWRPARVQALERGLIELLVGEPPPDSSSSPRYGFFTFRHEEIEAAADGFDPADLRPGRFLELAFYGDGNTMRIRAHEEAPWLDHDLLRLYPPPDRWVRRLISGDPSCSQPT